MNRLLKLPRNNTDFTSNLFEFYRKLYWEPEWNFLKYYQNTIRAYCDHVDSGAQGLLAYLGMGMGKSILAASIAVDMLSGPDYDTGFSGPDLKGRRRMSKCIFILTKSLAENMKGAIKKYFDLKKNAGLYVPDNVDQFIDEKFHFVSMNASNMVVQFIRAAAGRGLTGQLKKEDAMPGSILLKDTLIIVDEAHNLFRGITNGSKNGLGFFKTMQESLKIPGNNNFMLFLTGTPINNNPFELVPCFNLLANEEILPVDYQEFMEAFVEGSGSRRMKNESHFMDRILGLVAYVTHESTPGRKIREDSSGTGIEFPEDLGIKVCLCPMSPEQFSLYMLARENEMSEMSETGKKGPPVLKKMQLPKSSMSSSYRTKSRQLSNFFEGNLENKDPALIKDPWTPKYQKLLENVISYNREIGTLGLVYSQYVGIGGLGSLSVFLKKNGWKEYSLEYGNVQESDSQIEPDESFIESSDITVEDSEPKTGSGEKLIHDIFGSLNESDAFHSLRDKDPYEYIPVNTKPYKKSTKKKGSSEWDIDQDFFEGGSKFYNEDGRGAPIKAAKTFAVIKGGLTPESRKRIESVMTSPDNRHGEIISLVLVSSVGAEGLDFKAIRHIHILEPYWNYARLSQIQFRGIRNDSHKSLPKEEKNVMTFVYCAIPPAASGSILTLDAFEKVTLKDLQEMTVSEFENQGSIIADTTDTDLLLRAVKGYRVIESFLGPIQRSSITAAIDDMSNARLCAPTNQPLYTKNIGTDLKVPDACRPYVVKKVQANSVGYGDKTYYYIPDPQELIGFRLFDESKKSLPRTSPEYSVILDLVTKKEGFDLGIEF